MENALHNWQHVNEGTSTIQKPVVLYTLFSLFLSVGEVSAAPCKYHTQTQFLSLD